MNRLYQKGEYLLYDCSGYYVCTGAKEFNRCKELRKTAIKDLKVNLGCAPYKGFQNEKKCHEAQQELTNDARSIPSCTHPKEKFLR